MKRRWLIFALVGALIGRGAFGREPILLIAIEKSASVAIQWQLINSLGWEFGGVDKKDERGMLSIIDPVKLSRVSRKDCVLRGHYFPTKENIETLKRHQMRVVFHVRDLRQRVVSFAHHHLVHVRSGRLEKHYVERFGKPKKEITIEDMIEEMIPGVKDCVWMIEGWLDVYKSGEVPMLITTYEEFHDQKNLFFEKILSFYGIPMAKFHHTETPKTWEYHYRKGQKEEWQDVLTLDQIRRIEEQIPDELFEYFGWERYY